MTEHEYKAKLNEFEELFGLVLTQEHPDYERFMTLLTEIEAYEEKHYPIS
jgi:antitoxin component HigA of HigAB toxin-antitoxin module